ncbi:hypothetical protein BJX65DRAFT_321980 [Aspergillus insuetus]
MNEYSLAPRAQLTCETCKRRKVKCDKLRPCTNCCKAGIQCAAVERARLPRGRSAKKREKQPSPDMSGRLSVLEGLIQSLLNNQSHPDRDSTLLQQHNALPSIDAAASLNQQQAAGTLYGQFINQFVPTDYHVTAVVSTVSERHDPTSLLSPRLLQIYTMQVDPILPILQCSALWELVTPGGRYLDYPADHPAPRALGCAIAYMTITTLSSDQCSEELGSPRGLLLDKYRSLTQLALDRVDYMNTDDLTVLQAFVLFLISIQAHDRSRRAWTMLSLALRIAQSLFLDKADRPFTVCALERQMRQRLWHIICLLDVQASFDRGSAPMLHADCLRSQVFPAMGFLDFFIPPEDDASSTPETPLSNPTFMMVMAEAQRAFRSLDLSGGPCSAAIGIETHLRLQIAMDFKETAQGILKDFEPQQVLVHWFLEKIINVTYAFLQLVAVQPVQRAPSSSTSTSSTRSRDIVSQSTSLSLAVQFLQALNELHQNPRIEPFRWYTRLFVPWHALSVAMDQVCDCSDPSLQGYYWSAIAGLYSSLQELLSDAHRSLLRRPLHRFVQLSETCASQDVMGDLLVGPGLLPLY